ncbi:hypothetical protein MN608_10191 [Microdochium nivale]|nr:hypothetical protein MN608_10191 [Microdochium nivale]
MNNGPVDGHYHILAYTGNPGVELIVNPGRGEEVISRRFICARNATAFAVYQHPNEPGHYYIWVLGRPGFLIEHEVQTHRAVVSVGFGKKKQLWAIEKHLEPNNDDANNYFYAIRSLSSEKAGYLTRHDRRLGMEHARDLVIRDGPNPGEKFLWNQRWILLVE